MLVHIHSNNSTSSLETTHPDDVQPNAQDLRIQRVFQMYDDFIISEDTKLHRQKWEIVPDNDGYFTLTVGTYEVQFDNIVEIGPDEAGFVITRSTLNRNGLFFTSGLYDSGYKGAMAGALHVAGGVAKIKKGTRVAQFLVWKAEAVHAYNGSYGFNADGSVKSEEKRYHV